MPSQRPKRRVRRPARPIQTRTSGFMGHVQRFFLSFTPSRFKSYWISRAGLIRLAKLIGVGFLFIFLVFLWYAKDLPSPSKINSKLGLTTTFYARDELTNPGHGTKLYEVHGEENRLVIDFNQMPQDLKDATVAIEDRNFYKEGAFSVVGTVRAGITDVIHRGARQGGSTITQQYVKNSLLTNETSISRKVKELILSIEINQFYSKDDILKLYINEIPYGNGAYGIEAACRTYFSEKYGKEGCATHLNLGESALLASIPNAPSYYSPYGQNKSDLIARQHLVLDKMAEQKYVTQAEAEAAKWTLAQLDVNSPDHAINKTPSFFSAVTAPNFVYALQSQLEAKYGTIPVEEGGWKVITTLDANLQICAELSIYNPGNQTCKPDGKATFNPNVNNKNYKNLVALRGSNAALVAADPRNGQVLAMVGSYSFAADQNNVAMLGRPPGSSFKPYAYAALFSKNKEGCTGGSSSCATYGPGSVLQDTIAQGDSFGADYHPRDFGGGAEVGGGVTVRSALAGSLNIPAVQALKLAGTAPTIALAHSLGITTTLPPDDLSIVLGDGNVKLAEHVNAYESFANGGVHYDPEMVLKIYDNKNRTIEDNTKAPTPKKVLDPQVAYLMANILSDSDARAYVFGSLLNIPGHVGHSQQGTGVAAKTGTTTSVRDAWTMGFTPSIVAGVWAGNDDYSPMTTQAVNIAGPIWTGFMTAALTNKPIETFTKPTTSLQYLPIEDGAKQKSADNDYFPTWYKALPHKQVNIDKVSGKIATECTPKLAIVVKNDTGITATDDVHSCSDIQPTVNISNLSGGGPYTFKANVTLGTFGTAKTGIGSANLQIYQDDQIVSTQEVSGSGAYTVGPFSPPVGAHTYRAVITDTGLYQGSDSKNVTASGATASITGLTPAEGSSVPSGSVTFSWTSDPGATAYSLYIDGILRKTAIGGTSTTFPVNIKTGHTWQVKSDNDSQSKVIDFTAI